MKSKWRIPHPATMFFLFTLAVIFLSWIFDIYGLRVQLPQTGAEIRVQSLLSPEGIRWMLRNAITNFTGFAPLGMVLIAMFGIGVAQHSGFIDACVRQGVKNRKNTRRIILWVIILGLLPIAATLFYSVGLNPVAGIITAYVSVSCGYSANVVLSTMDPLIARTTQEAAIDSGVYQGNTGPLCNYYFMSVSTFVIGAIIYRITCKRLIPSLGQYEGKQIFEGYKQLSRKERRAMTMAIVVGMLYAAIILWATFSSWGILRGVNGGLIRSPFIMGILFLLSLGLQTISEYVQCIVDGFIDMVDMVIILMLGYAMQECMYAMGMEDFVSAVCGAIPVASLLPFIFFVFFSCSEYLFSLNYTLYQIAIPVMMVVLPGVGANVPLCLGAIISAGLFGANACVVSDLGVVSARACRVTIYDQYRTSQPYVLIAGAISAALYLAAGFIF